MLYLLGADVGKLPLAALPMPNFVLVVCLSLRYKAAMDNVWVKIRQNLSQTIENAHYNVWIAPLEAELANGVLSVFACNEFVAGFLRRHYQEQILAAASQVLGVAPKLEIKVTTKAPASISSAPANNVSSDGAAPAPLVLTGAAGGQNVTSSAGTQGDLPLSWSDSQSLVKNWRYSFDDFVVGPCNQLAHAAAHTLCGNHSIFSDVLFMCSAPGLGKTHLMHSVGASLAKASNFSSPRIEYLSAEAFSTQFRQALRNHEIDRFKARFRAADVLLLEDVHFLQEKEKTQDEVLALVSTLLDKGGKVVFTSSFAPRELRKMDGQLLSRFASGVIALIERPDAETRRNIICHKASVHQVPLTAEITDFLAESMNTDIRQIESCLQNLALKAKLFNRALTMDMVRETVATYMDNVCFLNMPEIIRMVCEGFGLSREALASKSRKQEYVHARNAVFFLARKHTELSLQEIGRQFNRSHSTVIKGITSLEREMSRDSHSGRQLAGTISLIERNSGIPARQ